MIKTTTKRPTGKVGKPRPDFPLFPHATGRWAKKVLGRLVYFGSTANDPKGVAALGKWLQEKDALLAGREPRAADPEATKIKELCKAFLSHKKALLEAAELAERSYQEYTPPATGSSKRSAAFVRWMISLPTTFVTFGQRLPSSGDRSG
jgi:hypothetical protein